MLDIWDQYAPISEITVIQISPMWLNSSFNHVVINYLECTLSIIAAKQYWLCRLSGTWKCQLIKRMKCYSCFSSVAWKKVFSLELKVDFYWITAICCGRVNCKIMFSLITRSYTYKSQYESPTVHLSSFIARETSAFHSVHCTSRRAIWSSAEPPVCLLGRWVRLL